MRCQSELELGAQVILGKGDVSLRQRGRWQRERHCERHGERCTMRPLRRCANAGECMQRCAAPARLQCIAAHLRRSDAVRAAGGRSCQTDSTWRLAAFRGVPGRGDFSLGVNLKKVTRNSPQFVATTGRVLFVTASQWTTDPSQRSEQVEWHVVTSDRLEATFVGARVPRVI